MAAVLLLSCLTLKAADYQLSVPATLNGGAGTTVDLPISVSTPEKVSGFQCQITLPQGVTLESVTWETSRLKSSTQKSFGTKTGVIMLFDNNGIAAGDGLLVTAKLKIADEGVKRGNNDCTITDIAFTMPDLSEKTLADVACTLNIDAAAVTGITLSEDVMKIKVGEYRQLTATVHPENAANKQVTWTSSDPEVAKVSVSGWVSGLKSGRAIITATSADNGTSASCSVDVSDVVHGYKLTLTDKDVEGGEVFEVPIGMTNATELRGFQCRIALPQELIPVLDEDGNPILSKTERTDFDNVMLSSYYDQENHVVNMNLYPTTTQASIVGSKGDMFSLRLTSDARTNGTFPVSLSNLRYSCINDEGTLISGTFNDTVAYVKVTKVPEYMVTVPECTGGVIDGAGLYLRDSVVTLTAKPNEGYHFVKWSNGVSENPYSFVIKCDTTISATFEENEYLLTFIIDSDTIQSGMVKYATAIVAPQAPEKKGYKFDGWKDVPETMPAHDLTIMGSYSKKAILGDVNGDGVVDIADINAVINIILKLADPSSAVGEPDINGDTVIDIADLNAIINIILRL